MKINKENIGFCIDNAEKSLKLCFNLLMDLSEGEKSSLALSLLEFQPLLAETLFKLMSVYQEICQLEKHLISNKLRYSTIWFKQKMALYAHYKSGISETIKIGKSIGDTFAWIFYRENNEELQKHFVHKETGLFTANIGGLGEIEFIKNNPSLYGCFVIYHGITNILRIGDFSLYAQGYGIIATGELKSEMSGSDLIVNAFLTSKYDLKTTDNPHLVETTEPIGVPNPQRLKRQLEEIKDMLSTRKADIKQDHQVDSLLHLLDQFKRKRQSIIVDKHNKFILSKHSCFCRKLSTLLLEKSSHTDEEHYDELIKTTVDILVPKQEYNSVYFGEINSNVSFYNKPIMLWDINRELIYDIVFRKCAIITIYNPSEFMQYFSKKGYKVYTKDDVIEFQIKRGNKVITLTSINFFLNLITNSLMSPKDVIALLEKSLTESIAHTQGNSNVELRILQK